MSRESLRNIFAIAKREIGGYFNSPVAYVFIVIFLLFSGFFTFMIGGFFDIGQANLIPFFEWHPWLYLFLVPAVGMRMWSEERRQGTMELLLTMPIALWEAIVGKFLASWAVLGLALALTFPMVITVNHLGHPDNGVIFAGYVGSMLLSGAYLAISSMTSAMTRNQVVSFILSLLICLFLILAGWPPVTNLLVQWASPSAVDTIAAFSVMTHFEAISKGLLDSRDILFFVSIIVFSLFTTSVIIRMYRAGWETYSGPSRKKALHGHLFSATGIAAMLVLLLTVNFVAAHFKQRIDITQERAWTLSPGTKAILARLDTPVQIRLYCTRGSTAMPVYLKEYAQRVEDLLNEYRVASHGLIEVKKLDPEPDSSAEDSAKLDGIEGQALPTGEKIYLGLSVTMLDQKQAIPFLTPARERLLEYDISRTISSVTTADKPVIGVMSPLPVMGRVNPMLMEMSEASRTPWVFISELQSNYTVKTVEMTADTIPADIQVLVVIHPKAISDVAQYALDQFVLRGGKLVAFLDPFCALDRQDVITGAMSPSSSSIDTLLKAWGIAFDKSNAVADMTYIGRTRQGRNPLLLALTDSAISREDVTTADVDNLFMVIAGAFTGTPKEGLKETVLMNSSKDSQLIDTSRAQMSGETLSRDFIASGTEYPLAVRLTGKFKTAFPDGKPKTAYEKPGAKPPDEKEETPLKESAENNTVVLVGDADMIQDPVAITRTQTQFGGLTLMPANGNLGFALNVVDNLAGGNDLMAMRSRASRERPFTLVKQMQAKAEDAYRDRIKGLEESLADTERKLNDLQKNRADGQRSILSPEEQQELNNFRRKESDTKTALKELRNNLRTDIDSLENRIKWWDIACMPALVAFAGLGIALFKRRRTAAG